MKVSGSPAIEGSYDIAVEMAENALNERESLGIGMPDTDDLEVNINLASLKGTKGRLDGSGEKTRAINLYAFDIAKGDLYKKHSYEIDAVSTYVRRLGDLPGNGGGLRVSEVLDDPEKAMEDYENVMKSLSMKKFGGSGAFVYDYNVAKEGIIRGAPGVRDIIKNLTPEMKEVFIRKGHKIMRHEMDHLELVQNSEMVKRYDKALDASIMAEVGYASDGKPADDTYRDAQKDFLNALIDIDPISEIRALFFSVINPGEWKDADFSKASEQVLGRYEKGYIHGETGIRLMIHLAKSLEGEPLTEKDLAHILSRNTRYQTDDFDRDNVFDFFNIEYPIAVGRIRDNAYRAADSIGSAYRDDPSRFIRANKVSQFGTYIMVCDGVF